MGDLAAVVVGRGGGGSRRPVLGLRRVLAVHGAVMADSRIIEWLPCEAHGLTGAHYQDASETTICNGSRSRVLSARPPDYEAATEKLDKLLSIAFPGPWARGGLSRLAAEVVDAALGGPDRLILDPEET